MQTLTGEENASTATALNVVKNATWDARGQVFVARSGEILTSLARGASDYVSANPITTATLATGVVLIAAPGLVATPALGAAGFTVNGVTAGSAAATVQAAIGNVAAGSPFAMAQSAAAGGYGLAAVHGVIQAAGGITVVGGAYRERSKL